MSEISNRRPVLLLSESWLNAPSELAFVTRTLAGAISRTTDLTVMVPATAGTITPDGAFDLYGAGCEDGGWPDRTHWAWPEGMPGDAFVISDKFLAETETFLPHGAGPIRYISPTEESLTSQCFRFVPDDSGSRFIGLQVPVNPMAASHRHNGLGFTDYILVLTDRLGQPPVDPPTPGVAWLTAAFPERDIVVVENAQATVWRGRVLRGSVGVDTRMDLWRLLSHALVTIDLNPGGVVARECIESLLFGTPIIVPAGTLAASHALATGGLAFVDVEDLLDGVDRLSSSTYREGIAKRGRQYADENYGDPQRFVDDVTRAVF